LDQEREYGVQLVMSELTTKVVELVQRKKRSILHHDTQTKRKKKRVS
jgi:hypothetical protein